MHGFESVVGPVKVRHSHVLITFVNHVVYVAHLYVATFVIEKKSGTRSFQYVMNVVEFGMILV